MEFDIRIDKYFEGELSETEESALWKEMENSADLMQQYEDYAATNLLFQSLGEPAPFKEGSSNSSTSEETKKETSHSLEGEFPLARKETILESFLEDESPELTPTSSEEILEDSISFLETLSDNYEYLDRSKIYVRGNKKATHKSENNVFVQWLSLIALFLLILLLVVLLVFFVFRQM